MEWNNRRYFIVNCGGRLHNYWIYKLKGIKSVKIHRPYQWNRHWHKYANYLVGVNSSKADLVIKVFNSAKKATYGIYTYEEVIKEMSKQ